MALHDRNQLDMDKEDGLIRVAPAVLLLTHIRQVWPVDTFFLPTSDLISLLVIVHPTVWGAEGPFGKRLTPQRLGRMLAKNYKINSTRESNFGPRGYALSDFTRAWTRMRVGPPNKPAQVAEPAEPAHFDFFEPDKPDSRLEPVTGRGVEHPAHAANGSTCTICGEPMLIVEAGQTTHPNCDPA
jgi:Protein of unknown function (DUF3631)